MAPNSVVGPQGQNFNFAAFVFGHSSNKNSPIDFNTFFLCYEPFDYPYCKIIICDKRGAINLPTQPHKLFFGFRMQKGHMTLYFRCFNDRRPHLNLLDKHFQL